MMKWWRDPFLQMSAIIIVLLIAVVVRDIRRAIAG